MNIKDAMRAHKNAARKLAQTNKALRRYYLKQALTFRKLERLV